MAQIYSDITLRLDEMFAKGDFSKFTPGVTKCAKKIRAGSANKINERGAFYLSQTQIPMNFTSATFGSNAGADFGDAGKVAYLRQSVTAKKRMSSVKWQSEVELQSQPGLTQRPGKTVDEKLQLIATHLVGYARAWSRELWSDKTNELARVSAINTTTNVVTCANAGNLFGVFNIHIGMDVCFYTSGGTKRTSGAEYVTVTAVNPDNRTFTYSGTDVGSVGNGDIIYPALGTISLKDEGLNGILFMLAASGAYNGVSDRTTNQFLMGTRLAASGAVLSAAWLRKMLDEQYYRLWGEDAEGTFYASTQRSAYEATELGKQSFAQGGDTLKKGYRKLYFDDAMFEKDPFVPRDGVAYTDMSQIDRFALEDYAPVKSAAGYEHQVPSTSGGTYQDNKMVLFRGFEQLGCEAPARLGVYADGFSTSGLSLGYQS